VFIDLSVCQKVQDEFSGDFNMADKARS